MDRAKVIRISSGAEGLRAAIESGMLAVDAQRAYKQVLGENTALKRENEELRIRVAQAEAINAEYREVQIEAIRREMEQGGKAKTHRRGV